MKLLALHLNRLMFNKESAQIITLVSLFFILNSIAFSQDNQIGRQVLAGWSPDIRLTTDPGNSYWPDITTDSENNIHVVWQDDRDNSGYEIRYMKLDSTAHIVVSDTRLTHDTSPSRYPRIIADSGSNVHIFWRSSKPDIGYFGEMGVYYTKFNKNGTPVFENVVLAEGTGDITNSLIPAIGIDNDNNLHILWDESAKYIGKQICYTKIDSSGQILVDKVVVTPPGIHAREPAIAVDRNNNLHIAWVDDTAPSPRPFVRYWVIKYMKLDNDGNTLVESFPITPAIEASSRYPALIADSDNNVHCFFHDYREGPTEVFYKKLNNRGSILIDDTNISKTSQNSFRASIAMDSQENIHLTWYEDAYGLTDEIYYAKMNKQGHLLIPTTRVDNGTSKVAHPRIAIDTRDRIHLVWSDNRSGDWDIYYKYHVVGTTEVRRVEKDKDFQEFLSTYELYQNYPNPFNLETVIGYYLPRDSYVTFRIYNNTGVLVHTLVSDQQSAGYQAIKWNGRNYKNKIVANGIYFYKLEVHSSLPFCKSRDEYTLVKKMLLLK